MKSLNMFTIWIIGLILNLMDYPFWHEVGIVSIMSIIIMILFRDKL